jgi:hypothetical protein
MRLWSAVLNTKSRIASGYQDTTNTLIYLLFFVLNVYILDLSIKNLAGMYGFLLY